MTQSREVKEGKQYQGVDESIAYLIDVTEWANGGALSAVTVKTYDTTGGLVDVTSTVMSGAASVNGNVITLPLLASLTQGHIYRVEVKFTCAGNIFEPFTIVEAQR